MLRTSFYNDAVRNARFSYEAYNTAINDSIVKFVDDIFGDIREKNIYGFQAIQQVRDDLFTVIKTSTIIPTTLSPATTDYGSFIVNHINNPADYYEFVALQSLIGGVRTYVRPTTYNEIGPLLEDSLKMPTNKRPYYLDDSTGYQVYRGNTGTLTSCDLTYIRVPATFNCGNDSTVIGPGNNLTINLDYIAIETSVNNTITYQPGQLFTAGATNLVSGQVILASNTTTCDLPDKVHEEIAKMASAIMSGTTSDFNRAAFSEKEAKDS